MKRLSLTTGHSDDPDEDDAVREAVAQAMDQLEGEPKAGLVFVSPEYDHALVMKELNECLPGLPLIGCSTDGEITQHRFTPAGVAVGLLAGDAIEEVGVGVGKGLAVDPEAAVQEAAAAAGVSEPTLVLTTPSSLRANLDATMRSLQGRFPGLPIVGGASGDRLEVEQAREYGAGEVHEDSLPLLLLKGDFDVAMGVASGWQPIGESWVATRTEGNVVYELDGKPALSAVKAWLGSKERVVMLEFPLAVFPKGDDAFFLRAVYHVDEETGAITLPAEIPQGSMVKVTRADADGVLTGAAESIGQVRQKLGGEPDGAIVFSCTARKWLLGTRADEEREKLLEQGELPFIGFYGFAELGPLGSLGAAVHNQTCVTVGLRAR